MKHRAGIRYVSYLTKATAIEPKAAALYAYARFKCNGIVIYPLDLNAKLSDTKCFTRSIR